MYAIVEISGHQYKVAPKDKIEVSLIKEKEGSKLVIDKVLLIQDGKDSNIGTPYIVGAKVEAKVLGQTMADKIHVFNMKPKKRVSRKLGHRTKLTELEIVDIKK